MFPRFAPYLAGLLILVIGAIAFRPAVHVFDTPLTEDGYYSLAVARNIAKGGLPAFGMTIDGVHPTNGFQPLFTFVEAGAYKLAGRDEALAIRLILLLSTVIHFSIATLIGLIARDAVSSNIDTNCSTVRRTRFWLGFLAYAGAFLAFMHDLNALETGALLLCYAALWRLYQLGWTERRWGSVGFGILAGLTVLTRIDAAIFVAVFVASEAYRLWRARGIIPALRISITIGGLALLISTPWFLYNYATFGSVLPTSGAAQQVWLFSPLRWMWLGWAVSATSLPMLWLGRYDEIFHNGLIPSLLRGLLFAVFLWLAWQRRSQWIQTSETTSRRTLRFGVMLLTALYLLALYYGTSFIAYWFYYRYLFPLSLLATVGFALLLGNKVTQRPIVSFVVIALLCQPTIISALLAQRGQTLHVQTVYSDQVKLAADHVPTNELVAAGQAGTLGYFRANTVNVDGKVNGDALRYQAHMWDYLALRGIRWFVDWPNYCRQYLGDDPTAHGWQRVAVSPGTGSFRPWPFELWHYDGDLPSGRG